MPDSDLRCMESSLSLFICCRRLCGLDFLGGKGGKSRATASSEDRLKEEVQLRLVMKIILRKKYS